MSVTLTSSPRLKQGVRAAEKRPPMSSVTWAA